MYKALLGLAPATLDNLAQSLWDGALSIDLNTHTLAQITGAEAGEVMSCLAGLRDSGMTPRALSHLVAALAAKARSVKEPCNLFDIVLSGPPLPSAPTRDTSATIISMISCAQSDILLVGYVVHRIRPLFERIAQRMVDQPALRTRIFLDIPRKQGDTSLSGEIVRRFSREFAEKHWPFDPKPALFYDTRSLEEDPLKRSSLHAKCVVIDRSSALVTSANLTEAAQQRNIELGVEIRHPETAERICRYFEGLVERGIVVGTACS